MLRCFIGLILVRENVENVSKVKTRRLQRTSIMFYPYGVRFFLQNTDVFVSC